MDAEMYRALIEDSPIYLVEVSLEGTVLLANKSFLDAVGRTEQEVVGREFVAPFIPETEHEKLNKLFGMIDIRSAERKAELALLSGNGAPLQVEWHSRILREPDGPIRGFLCIGVNVTERKNSDEELVKTKEYLENVLENSPDAVGIVDSKGRFLKWNRMAADLYGYTLQELRGKAAFDLYADTESLQAMMERLRADGFVKNYEIESLEWINDYLRFRKIDANVAPQNCEAGFKDRLGNFKDVFMTVASIPQSNKTVASILDISERKRAEDVACRYGGEEFIIIMPSASLEAGQARAEAIRQKIRNSKFTFHGREIGPVTVSLGVAVYDEQATATTADLLKAADTALYQAKQAGRDRVVVAGEPSPE